jgi:hypothetical protein
MNQSEEGLSALKNIDDLSNSDEEDEEYKVHEEIEHELMEN